MTDTNMQAAVYLTFLLPIFLQVSAQNTTVVVSVSPTPFRNSVSQFKSVAPEVTTISLAQIVPSSYSQVMSSWLPVPAQQSSRDSCECPSSSVVYSRVGRPNRTSVSQAQSQDPLSSWRPAPAQPSPSATCVCPSSSAKPTPTLAPATANTPAFTSTPTPVSTPTPPPNATRGSPLPTTEGPFLPSVKPSTPAIDTSNMYPFGPQQNDSEFRLEDSPYYSSYHCLRINTDWKGFPFFSERHYKLHICRNGKIQLNYEWSWWWPQKFGVYRWLRNMAVIAPFWATTDTYFAFRGGQSKVYYQVYKESKQSSSDILTMATKDVKRYATEFANFKATWVLVVTWEKLCPYVYYSLNCRWSNTFQAVIITNGFNTFLMHNYPYNGIQWVVPAERSDYRYWTGYYGLPVAGWNAGNDGKNYLNIKGSGTLFGMYNLDKKEGNTGSRGKHFWRIENSDVKDSLDKCVIWSMLQRNLNIHYWYNRLMSSDWQMACPCTEWQAWMDRGRFSWDWSSSWPDWCFESRRSKFIPYPMGRITGFTVKQQCCYSTQWEDWGSLKVGPPDGGHVKLSAVDDRFNQVEGMEEFYTDQQAYQFCCVDTHMCELFYFYRPSDQCDLYRPPPRRWFWGDPHIKTLDGGNYTFNGLGEYVMVDAKEGTFQLQARTKLAQGNSTKATIFSAGAAKEENTSTIEVRVKPKGSDSIAHNTSGGSYGK